MLHEAVAEPGERSPDEFEAAYRERLATALAALGVDAAAESTGMDRERLAALADGGDPEVTLGEAAALLAAAEGGDAEAIVAETRDHLLLGMTTAVLDVDTVAANVDVDLTGQEIQQAIEGRTRMTLSELAAIHAFVESRK